MKLKNIIGLLLLLSFITISCNKDETEPYTLRFIHIMDNESSAVTVNQSANAIGTYNVYLSSPQFFEPIKVTYNIVAGNGLVEGVDYQIVNNAREITFLPGIYDMPVRIKWLSNPIDDTKNNTITINLVSTDNNSYTLGLPGKDQKQKSLVITKVK
jgi:hypothetical protein